MNVPTTAASSALTVERIAQAVTPPANFRMTGPSIEFAAQAAMRERERNLNHARRVIAYELANLFEEIALLRMQLERKNALLFEVQQQVGNHCEDVKRHALTPGLRDRIDAEIGAAP